MEYSKSGLHLTEQFEGLRLEAYPDPGTGGHPWTIGYGHTGDDVYPGLKISAGQAEELLFRDIQRANDAVNDLVTFEITQEEHDACVDFVFNCGAGNFKSSTLLKKLNSGDIEGAADEFSKWTHAAGKVLAGLVKRREAEAALFLKSLHG